MIEPYLSTQWFVKVAPLAKPALEVVRNGEVRLHPHDRWYRTYEHWMENVRDWCISRQLWWGHRIPVYYCSDCNHMMVARETPEVCAACGRGVLRQENDVLDTWFSSWLWPFSTQGWPDNTEDLKYFYPTDLLVTGPDIIFFWVARMIMAGLEFMEQVPFRDVLLNGIVRDEFGRKMSKSLGNGIDPLEMIDTYSADAVRFTLVMLSSEGQDINLSTNHFEMGRNFSNKIWNAYRFLSMHLNEKEIDFLQYEEYFELADRWILSIFQKTIQRVGENLEKFRVNEALNVIYQFFWHDYCDWYLELIKSRLYQKEPAAPHQTALSVAKYIMKEAMDLLHPYIPFITEEIWQALKAPDEKSVVIQAWPEAKTDLIDPESEHQMSIIQEAIGAIRNIRADMNVPPAKTAHLYIRGDARSTGIINRHASYFTSLAKVENIQAFSDDIGQEPVATAVVGGLELFLPLAELVDLEKEKARLDKELQRLTGLEKSLRAKLANEKFLEKAPKEVIQAEKQKLVNIQESLQKVKLNVQRFKAGS